MKPIIIRKPKFMRNETVMMTHMNAAEKLIEMSERPNISTDQRIALMNDAFECVKNAAKADGFLSVGDMKKWYKLRTTT